MCLSESRTEKEYRHVMLYDTLSEFSCWNHCRREMDLPLESFQLLLALSQVARHVLAISIEVQSVN